MLSALTDVRRIDRRVIVACPAGGDHAPVPVQGKGYSVCAKCGASC